MMPPTLDYDSSKPERPQADALLFWTIYLVSSLVSLVLIHPALDIILFGHPGDIGIMFFCLLSIAVVTVVMGVLFLTYFKRFRPSHVLFFALFIGLGAVLPAYAVMWFF